MLSVATGVMSELLLSKTVKILSIGSTLSFFLCITNTHYKLAYSFSFQKRVAADALLVKSGSSLA